MNGGGKNTTIGRDLRKSAVAHPCKTQNRSGIGIACHHKKEKKTGSQSSPQTRQDTTKDGVQTVRTETLSQNSEGGLLRGSLAGESTQKSLRKPGAREKTSY